MSSFVVWNGQIVAEDYVLISPNNHSFRYGDGCFETMKIVNGKILLNELHFQRLFSSLNILKFSVPPSLNATTLYELIKELLHANHHTTSARVRLVMYRGNGGLYDLEGNQPQFIIQSFPASHGSDDFNEAGLTTGIFPDARKAADSFSSIKSNNYLPYVMGAIWAKENTLDDCLIQNSFNRIADATIANIFIVSDGIIKTPALSEGCINGVMRSYLLRCLHHEKIPFLEAELTPEELLNASEVFLTNATYGIRWVKKVGVCLYHNETSSLLHKKFIVPLFDAATL